MKYWIIILLLMALVFAILKSKEIRHKLGQYFVLVIALLTISSVVHIYLTTDLDLTTFDGLVEGGKIYFSWLGNVFGNVRSITGQAVHQDWSVNSPGDTNLTDILSSNVSEDEN